MLQFHCSSTPEADWSTAPSAGDSSSGACQPGGLSQDCVLRAQTGVKSGASSRVTRGQDCPGTAPTCRWMSFGGDSGATYEIVNRTTGAGPIPDGNAIWQPVDDKGSPMTREALGFAVTDVTQSGQPVV